MNAISSTNTSITSSSGRRSSIKNLDAGTSLVISANIKKAKSRRRGSIAHSIQLMDHSTTTSTRKEKQKVHACQLRAGGERKFLRCPRGPKIQLQSNLTLRNFLVTPKKFLKVKSSLFQTFNQSTI